MRRHSADLISLSFGLVFSAFGAAFLFEPVDVTDVRFEWLWPVVLIVLGLAVLTSTGFRREPADEQPESPVEDEPGGE